MFAIVDQVAAGLNVPVDLFKVFLALLTSFLLSTLPFTKVHSTASSHRGWLATC